MVSETFTGKTKESMENNKGELYVSELKSVYSDEQKELNAARQKFAEQPNEQPGTTDKPDLENEESAEQKKSIRTRLKSFNTKPNGQWITNFFSSIKSRK